MKLGDRYYFIDLDNILGDFLLDRIWMDSLSDNERFELGNCFPYTEEGKQKALKKIEQIKDILKQGNYKKSKTY